VRVGVFGCEGCHETVLLTHIDNASFHDLVMGWNKRCPVCHGHDLKAFCIVTEKRVKNVGTFQKCEECTHKYICITSTPKLVSYDSSRNVANRATRRYGI
jgi:hypothetical protein